MINLSDKPHVGHLIVQRNSLIDIAKGIGILFVVFGHNWIVLHEKRELFRIIFSFHMPLFFVLSGVFMRPSDQLIGFIKIKLSLLIKPFFVVSFIACTLKFVKSVSESGTYSPIDALPFLKVLYGTGSMIPVVPLWFLTHLFVALIVSLLIIKKIRSITLGHVLVLCALMLTGGYMLIWTFSANGIYIGSEEVQSSTGLPWSIDLLPITCSFIVFGYTIRDLVKGFSPIGIWPSLALAVFAAFHWFFNETIDLNLRIYGNLIVSTAQAMLGIYLCLCLAATISRVKYVNRVASYIGSRSLFILIFHGNIQSLAFGVASKYIANPYICGTLSFLVGTIAPLAIYEITKRVTVLRLMLLPVPRRLPALSSGLD